VFNRISGGVKVLFRSVYVGFISLAAATFIATLAILPVLAVRAQVSSASREPADGYLIALSHSHPVLCKTVPVVIFLGGFVGGWLRFSRSRDKIEES